MRKTLCAKYPPYDGTDPYILLCFDKSDFRLAEPLLRRLWRRGCRIWYPSDATSEIQNQQRIEGAELVLVINTDRFASSKAKRNMMFLQSKGVPVIVVDFARGDLVSTGERVGTTHISALDGITDAVESKLITAEGFSQDLIGERPPVPVPGWVKGLLAVLAALVAVAALFLGLNLTGVIHPAQDPIAVYTLILDCVPEDITELEQYPNLETIIIPQSEAEKAEALLERYTVVLRGEKE